MVLRVSRVEYRKLVARINRENEARRVWDARNYSVALTWAAEDPRAMPRQYRTDLRFVGLSDL